MILDFKNTFMLEIFKLISLEVPFPKNNKNKNPKLVANTEGTGLKLR